MTILGMLAFIGAIWRILTIWGGDLPRDGDPPRDGDCLRNVDHHIICLATLYGTDNQTAERPRYWEWEAWASKKFITVSYVYEHYNDFDIYQYVECSLSMWWQDLMVRILRLSVRQLWKLGRIFTVNIASWIAHTQCVNILYESISFSCTANVFSYRRILLPARMV